MQRVDINDRLKLRNDQQLPQTKDLNNITQLMMIPPSSTKPTFKLVVIEKDYTTRGQRRLGTM
jgi:hypothetical protein